MAGAIGTNLDDIPKWYQTVGIILALSSGFFIGLSLILQKKGLIDTQELRVSSGNEFSYLQMFLGELSNFVAYAFTPAIIVTPLGAVSVVVSAILSFIFLGEKLNFSGVCGIILCIIGSVIIVFHGPPSTQTATVDQFFIYVMKPGFLVYSVFVVGVIVWLLVKVVPVHGSSQPIVYLSITSLGGAFLVNAAQGFGSSIVYSMRHWEDDNQFFNWKLYPLGVFVGVAAVFQILYLNKSLQYFSTSIVTPVNYVFFSTATLVTSAVLYEGFNVTSFINGATIVLGFAVIVIGVALLFQYNLKLNKLAQKLAEENLLKNEAPKVDVVAALEKAINEPSSDQNPFTLMIQTFPIRPGRSPHSTSERPSRSQPASEVPGFKDTSNLTVTSMVLPNRTESPEVDPKLSGTL